MADSLSPELRELVEHELATGKYDSENDLLLKAVRLLADRDARREKLRQEIQIGRDQLDRGEYTQYDQQGLRERFDQIKDRVRKRTDRSE